MWSLDFQYGLRASVSTKAFFTVLTDRLDFLLLYLVLVKHWQFRPQKLLAGFDLLVLFTDPTEQTEPSLVEIDGQTNLFMPV